MTTWKDMLTPQRDSEEAKKVSKAFHGERCIVTGQTGVDGCHFFDVGSSKHRYLAALPLNILPMVRAKHSPFDRFPNGVKRKPMEKWAYIQGEAISGDARAQVDILIEIEKHCADLMKQNKTMKPGQVLEIACEVARAEL